ncbi:S8 family serine peptidase [Kitasatospora sp. NPDC004615]|uniref:S8 family peptidase n=1 Tax=Kitasatospora sp. NPDC004615 TaxID=3364017 RepID=UPI0036B88548
MSDPSTGGQSASDELAYFPNAGSAQLALVRDPAKFSVRFGIERDALQPEAQDLLRNRATQVEQLAGQQLIVYTLSPAEAASAVQVLNRERSVEVAAPVLHRAGGGQDDIYVTSNFVVQFRPEVTRAQIDQLNSQHGVQVVEELGYAENGFLLAAPAGADGLGAIRMANTYRATGLTLFSHPDLISKKHRRRAATVAAPAGAGPSVQALRDAGYVSLQWHLQAANVVDAWSLTMGDPAIHVAILDDGTDTSHPEFAGKLGPQFDFSAHIPDATPKSDLENHGTACTGVAAAKGIRASGAAPECSLMLARFPEFLGSADEARMFQWAADNGADVISCSWGPPDGAGVAEPLPGATDAAIAYCLQKGRGGRGIPICWAAGNGNESVDKDGYSSNPNVIAVAASTNRERRAYYSDFGNAIWVCAPSSGAGSLGEKSILTTDRTGAKGYNDGSEGVDADFTNSFGGTSSAAPLVAGIIGLVLSANPGLTAQQVRGILKDTARKIGDGYDATGHSPDYGYGQVDAHAAVLAAQSQSQSSSSSASPPQSGRDLSVSGPAGVSRLGPPPVFTLDAGPGPQLFFAVEVATAAMLFDRAGHGAGRRADTFYASWQDTGFLSGGQYSLPDQAWQRLRAADALYYRAWFSSSSQQWTDARATTSDADFASAPAISITGQASADRELSVSGPAAVSRSGPPPVFTLDAGPGPQLFFAVEVATAAMLFDRAGHGAERTADTFYASWQDTGFLSGGQYSLPDQAWQRLRAADVLYYRAWFSSSSQQWTDARATTPDSDYAGAPSVAVGAAQQVAALHSVEHPQISGPAEVASDGPAPVFGFSLPAAMRSYRVEIAADAGLLDAAAAASRNALNFFASTTANARGTGQYRLPGAVWEQLRQNPDLYYRIAAASTPADAPDWVALDYSTPDAVAERAPRLAVTAPLGGHGTGRVPATGATNVTDPDELHWRQL